jgi:hypothetical protein
MFGAMCALYSLLAYHLLAVAVMSGLQGLTSLQIAERLGLQHTAGFRGVTDWLDVLVSLDNLTRSGEASPLGCDGLAQQLEQQQQHNTPQPQPVTVIVDVTVCVLLVE